MLRAAPSLLACLLGFLAACAGRPALHTLEPTLRSLASAVDGDVGIYVRDLTTGDELGLRADESFPTASLIKVPILAALLSEVDAGKLDYHQKLTYRVDRKYAGDDLLGAFTDGATIELSKLAMLTITTSDNTASLWCQELAGTGTAINDWLAQHGFAATRVNSRTPGREGAQKEFGWGVTTPREMTELLVQARSGQLGSPAMCEELCRCLARVYWDGEALASIPPHIHVLSKQGAVNRSRSEVVLVHGPDGDYAFCVITKNQRDQSWERDNQGYVLLREVSRRLWAHFAPGQPYSPPSGHERF